MEEAFSENSMKLSDCRAFSLFKTVPDFRAFTVQTQRKGSIHVYQLIQGTL